MQMNRRQTVVPLQLNPLNFKLKLLNAPLNYDCAWRDAALREDSGAAPKLVRALYIFLSMRQLERSSQTFPAWITKINTEK